MASTTTVNSVLDQFQSLSQLHIVRQLGFMLILAASIALGTATVLWSQSTGYSALYMSMSSQDSADVVAALEQSGTDYRINNGSGLIMVPGDELRQIRMQLANQGLPRSTSRGFDILDEQQSLGTSNFMEQARYQRALEQELVQTIKQIQGVRDARVHLSIPKQTSFIRNSRQPSASVMIDITNLNRPGDAQLSGILHLVASSVAGMETERVSIVDQRGNLLSENPNSEFGNSNETLRYTREIEQEYTQRILDILTPIVGPGKVRAQVSANLDFTAVETTEEIYNPDTTVVRSEQIQEERRGLEGNALGAEPGTLSPTPPTEEQLNRMQQVQNESNRQTRVSSTRNYEIDRSVSRIRRVPGDISQLSVAVLVDLHPEAVASEPAEETAEGGEGAEEIIAEPELDPVELQARIDRLTQLVQDTIGFNAARGDSVSIINERFVEAERIEVEEPALWEQSWFSSTLKQAAASAVVVFLIFGVLRPALKTVVSNENLLPNRQVLPAGGVALSEDQVAISAEAEQQQQLSQPSTAYDRNLSKAQHVVMQEPTRAARMIQNWLAEDR